jgi:5-methylcytosine-specific restriction enzyme A
VSGRRRFSPDLRTVRQAGEMTGSETEVTICPLCDRAIPPGARSSQHHLIPKLKGGAKLGTVRLHQICHSAIHAGFSEAEIARWLSDVESLKREAALADFLDWIRTKPDAFMLRPRLRAAKRAASRW